MMVPHGQRWRLLATFNGGFTYADGDNGSTDNGRVNEPLKDGNATLVGYRDGRVAIVRWNGGPNAGHRRRVGSPEPAPIVWDGRLNPAFNDNPDSPQWGFTLGDVTRVWRTGVGIDRRGDLIFVAADGQTVITLAKILRHVGAVRAMQFDINPDWHTLITYTHDHGLVPTDGRAASRTSRPIAISCPTTATSSPSTGVCPARSPSPSSRRITQRRKGAPLSLGVLLGLLARAAGSSCASSSCGRRRSARGCRGSRSRRRRRSAGPPSR